jgi:hypothetical protein
MTKTEEKIKEIRYPNTVFMNDQGSYIIGKNCDEIRRVYKNGEMATIGWFAMIKDGKKIAEIKESVCDIYYTR